MEDSSFSGTRSCESHLILVRTIVYILWLSDIIFTAVEIWLYFCELKVFFWCRNCVINTFKVVALMVLFIQLVQLFIALPLIILEDVKKIRLYLTIYFLGAWLDTLLTLLLAQDTSATSDVIRHWKEGYPLKFFEENFACCGVLGPKDYLIFRRPIPDSCYKNFIRENQNLFKGGCTNVIYRAYSWTVAVMMSKTIQV
ncbi:hypothetical protein KR018_012046 [Drosophila ironensis]|nr:hypothetical protein KR018_012046 [Drosophila ironensis]